MDVGFKFVFDRFGFDNPLIGAIPVLVNKFGGFVVVHGLNLSLGVLHIRTLNLKILDEHYFSQRLRMNEITKGIKKRILYYTHLCWVKEVLYIEERDRMLIHVSQLEWVAGYIIDDSEMLHFKAQRLPWPFAKAPPFLPSQS